MGPGGKGLLCAAARLTEVSKNNAEKALSNKLNPQVFTAARTAKSHPTGAISMVEVQAKKGQAGVLVQMIGDTFRDQASIANSLKT